MTIRGFQARQQCAWPNGMKGMKHSVVFTFLLVCLSLAQASAAEQISRFWRPSAAAEHVAVGTLHVPVDEIRADIASGSTRYIDVAISIDATLKGELPTVTAIRHFTRDRSYNISNDALIALDGQRVILFLVRGLGGLYFPNIGPEALQPAFPSSVAELRTEIARQDLVSRSWMPHPDSPHRAEVQALIERLLLVTTQDRAVQELDALAPDAIIAIIDLMDDRRQLGKRRIALRNRFPNAFEAYAQYGPEMVIDVCVGILTGSARAGFFSSIVNGGSEQERQMAVAAWRVYADIVLNHPKELEPPAN
jgi:hypothetical protein